MLLLDYRGFVIANFVGLCTWSVLFILLPLPLPLRLVLMHHEECRLQSQNTPLRVLNII